MFRPNAPETGRVSLVQANDTVRSVVAPSPAPSTTSSFAPSVTMSKQPVRVLQRPPQPGRTTPSSMMGGAAAAARSNYGHHQPQQHGAPPAFVHLGAQAGAAPAPRSYAELVEIAELQRRQIDANRKEEERRNALFASRGGHGMPRGADLQTTVKNLRREVAEGELELKRLTELERETRALRVRNDETSGQVEMLTRTAEEEQAALRKAAAKVDSLRAQLEELHRRRRAAKNAALLEAKRMQTAQAHVAQMRAVSSATPTPDVSQRPRASVEPFQIQQTKTPEEMASSVSPNKAEKEGVDETDQRLHHPPTPSDAFMGRGAAPAAAAVGGGGVKIRVVDQQVTMDSHARVTMTSSSSSVAPNREDISPSPPKDPHPTEPGTIAPGAHEPQEPAELAHARLRGSRADLVSIRAESLKATKRRSWAASESTMSELDSIRRVLLEQQLKGRTHYIADLPSPASPAPSSVLGGGVPSSVGGVSSMTIEEEKPREEDEEKTEDHSSPFTASSSSSIGVSPSDSLSLSASATSASASSAAATFGSSLGTGVMQPSTSLERPTALGGVQKEEELGSSSAEEAGSLCSTRSSEDAANIEMEVPQPSRTVKGILRPKGRPASGRRIEFDPLALLLDAALEGEIELVRESAKKLSDVSASNDEGITALHNAICAGHYEIVRFLIDANADVNAQDSDGWTPLHCAASCNNLPMVRVLVEGGACVLSSTLSDLETPVQKCEEEEDGYDGCLRYLIAAHNATGSANVGTVYAAYPYAAEYEDELSFEGGDKLCVLQKDAPNTDSGWWLCEKQREDGTMERGLAPRTLPRPLPAPQVQTTTQLRALRLLARGEQQREGQPAEV
ncbi:hypothetical protein PMAYCL1PPCAC_28033, partial [Pristionchus mayeri]